MINVLTHVASDSRSADVAAWLQELGFGVYNNPQAILVSGGDGTLLEAIHKYQELQLPFFGINRGTCGFLLNPINSREELVGALGEFSQWRIIDLKLLRVVLLLTDGTMRETFAFNDAFFKASRGEIAGVVSGERFPEQKFCGDGIIISTPQGSTAYNKSAGGSILPLEKNLIAVTSICSAIEPMRLVVSDQVIEVKITRNQSQSVFRADRFDTNGCVSAYVYPDGPRVRLAFRPGYDFEFRRYQPRFS